MMQFHDCFVFRNKHHQRKIHENWNPDDGIASQQESPFLAFPYARGRLNFFNFGKKDNIEKQEVNNADEKDPVEKVFSFFFGEPEAEPLGLKRFGRERFPEQYPATIDEWAEPVDGDTPDVAILRSLLKNTNFEFRQLRLAYDANKDGWDAISFRKKVEKQGAGLLVAKTTEGLLCGGYNPKGWVGYGEGRGSIAAVPVNG
jgi:hypothetical protein